LQAHVASDGARDSLESDLRTSAGAPVLALAETCRVIGREVPLWAFHRERLARGGCGDELLADVERSLADAIAAYSGVRSSRLRAHLEVGTDGTIAVEVVRRLSSLDVVKGPVLVPVSSCDLADGRLVLPAGASKPADRSWWDAAARVARRRGGHQALIFAAGGAVIDGSSATVWAVIDDTLVTVPAPPAVAGVARAFILREAPRLGLEVSVRPLHLSEVEGAAEVMLTNAFGGAVAVRERGGPVTDAIRQLFGALWNRASLS
jgi:branched-subunit amino acid aminotransferase/4-amino-4-deoxychorismate lyase